MVNQDPMHTPHPIEDLALNPLIAALENVALKLFRDVAVSVAPVLVLYFTSGHVDMELFLPALGLGIYRAARDVLPKVFGSLPAASL